MRAPWMQPEESFSGSSYERVRLALQRDDFRPVAFAPKATARLLETCRSLFSEANAHLAVLAAGQPEPASWRRHGDPHDEPLIAEAVLRSRGFADALPEVLGARRLGPPRFSAVSPLLLDGTLARVVQEGGPRWRFSGTGAEAKALAVGFCSDVFGDRYDDVVVEHSRLRWSTWFKGVAWDHTWVVTDLRRRRLTVLCLTDGG